MPEMDGYEATAEIRRRESEHGGEGSPRTSIIAMTANAMQGDREKVIEAGMDDYVSKPVKSEGLQEVLKRWVKRETQETDAPLSALDTGSEVQEEVEDPIDYVVLESLRELQEEGEPDILAELVEMFVSDTEPRLAALREAVESGDASGVEQTAHALKGSTGNMGARSMALAADLQDIGASGDLAGAARKLERLEEEYNRVRPALAELVKGE